MVDPNRIDAESYAAELHSRAGRDGVSVKEALRRVRADATVLACLMLARGEADAAICGSGGRFRPSPEPTRGHTRPQARVHALSTLNAVVLPSATIFIADAYVNIDPPPRRSPTWPSSPPDHAADGVTPRAALVSHANFGDRPGASSRKMREAMEILRERAPISR